MWGSALILGVLGEFPWPLFAAGNYNQALSVRGLEYQAASPNARKNIVPSTRTQKGKNFTEICPTSELSPRPRIK